jgi:hypothetical protein
VRTTSTTAVDVVVVEQPLDVGQQRRSTVAWVAPLGDAVFGRPMSEPGGRSGVEVSAWKLLRYARADD